MRVSHVHYKYHTNFLMKKDSVLHNNLTFSLIMATLIINHISSRTLNESVFLESKINIKF